MELITLFLRPPFVYKFLLGEKSFGLVGIGKSLNLLPTVETTSLMTVSAVRRNGLAA